MSQPPRMSRGVQCWSALVRVGPRGSKVRAGRSPLGAGAGPGRPRSFRFEEVGNRPQGASDRFTEGRARGLVGPQGPVLHPDAQRGVQYARFHADREVVGGPARTARAPDNTRKRFLG